MSAPEKVFPAPAPPAGGGGSGSVGVGRFRVDKKTAGIVGGVVVVIAGLVAASRNGGSEEDPEATAILDTTDTDVYNELQTAIENLTEELGDRPRPPKPGNSGNGDHKPNPPGPKPGGGPKGHTYRVAKGDKIGEIAKKFKVSALRLYRINRKVIEAAARDHGRKSSQMGRYLYPGTVLEIPGKK